MAKVLVTGGAGFIGSHIIDVLCENGDDVRILDNAPLLSWNVKKEQDDYFCDIRNFRDLEGIFYNFHPEYVIHCAAKARIQPSLANPVDTYEVNVMGTLNLIELSRRYGIKKFIYSGSSSVYAGYSSFRGRPLKEEFTPWPLNPYAYSKLMAEMLIEQYVRNYNLKAVILRYFNVYGPRQPSEGQYATVIGIFLRQWKNKEPLTIVPDGLQKRDFTWVGDVVDANIMAMESEAIYRGEVINIGCGKNYSILEVADIIGGKDYPRIFIEPRLGEARTTLADISRAKAFLNWEPKVFLEQGIEFLKKQLN